MTAYCHIYGQLGQTGDRLVEELEFLFAHNLPCDLEMPIGRLEQFRDLLLEAQRRGGLVAPTIYPPDLDPSISDANWWKLPVEECVRLLQIAREEYARLGFGPLEAINTYTPGNTLVTACRPLGIKYILGFCAPIVIEDGGWEIAHYGSPLSPYFISDEDYRKPENPSDRSDSVLMASMELRNPIVCLNHWSEGPWCPLNALAVDRWLEPSENPYPFLQIANDWIQQALLDQQPRFFHINLQYFFAGRCFDHNRRALEWLARQRDEGRLQIGGLREWAERMRERDGFLPQTTLWRAEMPGFHPGHRPGLMPDVLVEENLNRQAIWLSPQMTPFRYYDYTAKWEYAPFQPDGSAPESRVFDGLNVQWHTIEEGPTFRRGELIIANTSSGTLPPLAIWEILDGASGDITIEAPSHCSCRIVPHPTGIGGVVILECRDSAPSRISITAHFATSSTRRDSRIFGSLIAGATFYLDGRTYTMLAAQTPEAFTILLKSTAAAISKSPALLESLCGNDYQKRELTESGLTLAFDASRLSCWHRLWDVTLDDIILEGIETEEARLQEKTARVLAGQNREIPAGAIFQKFGNIRDPQRWDRAVGRQAGLDEIERMNHWFHQQRPDVGTVCLELHAGIFMPRGSITKVLGHEFDVIESTPGYGLKELCVDYPQGWDWGVAAWVQWRWLKIRLTGLQFRTEKHSLHLHAIDPEHRDLCQRIHFIHPENPALPHLCVESCWEVPAGLDARWTPQALRSLIIPDQCYDWPAIDVWINPLERTSMYDWIAEKGAPGMLSHLWLTRETLPAPSPSPNLESL